MCWTWFWLKKTIQGVEIHWLSGKQKVLPVKKVMLTEFWNMKGPSTIGFQEKSATVINAAYCQLFKQNSSYLLNDFHIWTPTWLQVNFHKAVFLKNTSKPANHGSPDSGVQGQYMLTLWYTITKN